MKVIFISDNGRHHKKINVKLWSHIVLPLFLLSLLTITAISVNNYFNNDNISRNEAKLLNRFDVLLKKAATLEAQVQRLNTLGTTLASQSNIDIQSFLLEKAPARGGINGFSKVLKSSTINEADLVKSIQEIEYRLAEQKAKFGYIRNLVVNKYNRNASNIKAANYYSSPVEKGYISSTYGNRRDPINGHQRHHNGIDIADKQGSNIHAIASGFVTFSGVKKGYGNIIEIHHSDSLKSRYAHLNKISVEKGDVTRKGDIIATMGKTGRATGSHLHLEVWKDGQPVDPESFINIALANLGRLTRN